MGYPCVSLYILFCMHRPAIVLCFWVARISQNYSNSKWPLDHYLKIVCSQKLFRLFGWHCCAYLPNKKKICWKLSWNTLTGISLLVALVIKGLITWESKCHQNLPVVSDGYVKYEEAEVHRSAIMQDFRDNEKKNLDGRLAAILDFTVFAGPISRTGV